MSAQNYRKTEAKVDEQFPDRWSPRAFSSEAIGQEDIESLFEAARWAPSAFNEQPWLFLCASTEEERSLFRPLFTEMNLTWCGKAPVLIFVLAKRNFKHNGKPNDWARFDTGAAWMALALQARKLGLYTHAMAGIHAGKVYETLNIPSEEYEVVCGMAAGKYGDANDLPDPVRKREQPNDRKPLEEIYMRGKLNS